MSYLQESCNINCHVCRKKLDVKAPPCCFIFLRYKLLYCIFYVYGLCFAQYLVFLLHVSWVRPVMFGELKDNAFKD